MCATSDRNTNFNILKNVLCTFSYITVIHYISEQMEQCLHMGKVFARWHLAIVITSYLLVFSHLNGFLLATQIEHSINISGVFHNKTFIISLTNFCKLVKIKEPQQFCEICNVSFNEDQQENHRDCQPDVCRTSLEVSLYHFFCISYVSFLELFKREFSAPTGHFFSLSA